MNVNIILIILLSIVVILYIINLIKENKEINELKNTKKEELKNVFKERWDKEEKDFSLKKAKLQIREKEIENKIAQLETIFKEKENQYKAINQDLEFYRKGKIKEIDSSGAEYEKRKQLIINNSINEYRALQMCRANTELIQLEDQKENILNDIQTIKNELEAERSKRAAINDAIRRQRQMEEEGDFYRIQLSLDDKKDVHFLRDVAPRLQHPEVVNKIIWSGYYQKPLAELRKRILPNGDISGIYKITRLKTKELYIGQSTSIDRRLQDHVKTALGVGTLANSRFHRVLFEDGPENFYFEILEEADKGKLRERESYYIDWFKSDRYGLNTVKGDQNK